MPSYKLSYFDARGRAEVIRLLFVYAGKEFEDHRIAFQEWPTFKLTTPFGQVPVLEVDGQMIAQTVAICNYVAREFGLYGKTNTESCQIDQVVCLISDFISANVKYFREPDEARKAEFMKVFVEQECPKYLGQIENLLQKNGTGYFVGDKVTLADFFVYSALWNTNGRHPGFFESYNSIKKHQSTIGSIPQIKTHIDNRKKTDF